MVIEVGSIVGLLTVIEKDNSGANIITTTWKCRCECGSIVVATERNLRYARIKSCGCLKEKVLLDRNTKHGLRYHELYEVWLSIKQRTLNHKNKQYINYGGRGITIDKTWSDSFETFLNDMGNRTSKEHSIDRIDNNRGYSKDNCRWVLRSQNNCNQRIRNDGSSKYKGVHFDKQNNKWIAQCSYKGVRKYCGSFTYEIDAAVAYDTVAESLQGEFSILNRDNFTEVMKRTPIIEVM